MIVAIVFVEQGQRRIPVQFAKRVVGRRMYGGQSTYIPLKVNQAGVIPIIFASSVLYFPVLLSNVIQWKASSTSSTTTWSSPTTSFYITIYGLLIVFFTYFYTAITFNPQQQADIIRKQGGFIPGIRPGRRPSGTSARSSTASPCPARCSSPPSPSSPRSSSRSRTSTSFPFGGTTILIAVGVALETMKQIDSQLMMRNYEGFLT